MRDGDRPHAAAMVPTERLGERSGQDRAGRLTGRLVLVTGGSRGIGAAVSRSLSGEGATVAITYQNDKAAAARVMRDLGETGSAWRLDVRSEEDSRALVESLRERHGPVDVLVANAGVWRGGRIEKMSPDDWRLVVDTAVNGTYNVVRAVVPGMRERGFGRIIVIASAIGLIGFAGDSAYAAAKAAHVGFIRALAKELGRDGITVNAVAPGFVDTDMTAAVPEKSRALMLERAALRRPGTVDEIAHAVRFLARDGDYVTGHVLVVDGGLSL
jgi:3-oxoacyl-[acyl-carrier protein] reductase